MGLFDDIRKLTQPYEEDGEEFLEDTGEEKETPISRRRERVSAAPSAEQDYFREETRESRPERVYRTTGTDSRLPFRDTNEYARATEESTEFRTSTKDGVLNVRTKADIPVALIQPDCFEQAAEIADHLRDHCAVVMNLEKTSRDVARRLVDFLSGVVYANDGKIQKVAVNTYILLPFRWDLAKDIMDELENSGAAFF